MKLRHLLKDLSSSSLSSSSSCG